MAKTRRVVSTVMLVAGLSCGGDGAGKPPAAPSGLTVTALDGGAHLTWKDNSSDEESFEVERQAEVGFEKLGVVTFDIAQFHVAVAAAGKTHTYRVRAKSAAGYSAYSNEATLVP